MKIRLQFLILTISFLIFSNTQEFSFNGKLAGEANKFSRARENQSPDISYSIEPFYDVNAFRLIVVLEFQGDKSGTTKIIFPNSQTSSRNNSGVRFLKTLSPNTYIDDTDKPEIKTVRYTPNTVVRIYYQFEETRDGEIEAENYYMAIVNKKYFHFYSDTFFILPAWDLNTECNIRIAWNHMPSNWNLANSFGVNQKIQEVKIPLWKFRHAVFAGGDYRIYQRMIGQSPVYFAIRGQWNFPEDQLCDFSTNIFNAERKFWNDYSSTFTVEIVLPMEEKDSQIATSRTNALSLFLSPDKTLDYQLKQSIAREYFHNWLGDGITFADPQELIYWFKEGFASYYGRLLLLRARLISLDEYVNQFNQVLRQYFTSPVRYEKNERLVKEFWSDEDLNKLPFLRGDIFASNINCAIMKNSNGQKSLDDLMRDLYKRCRTEALILSNGSLSALIRFYAGDAVLSDIMRTLNSNVSFKVSAEALGPCFTLEILKEKKFWLIGEKYFIPFYKPKNENQSIDKNCLWWFEVE